MNLRETGALVGLIAIGDNRQVDDAVVRHWHDLVGDLDFEDACDAVKAHRRESRTWLLPVDVRERVHTARRARLAAVPDLVPGMVADGISPDDPAWFDELARRRAAAMERHPAGGQRQVEGGHRG